MQNQTSTGSKSSLSWLIFSRVASIFPCFCESSCAIFQKEMKRLSKYKWDILYIAAVYTNYTNKTMTTSSRTKCVIFTTPLKWGSRINFRPVSKATRGMHWSKATKRYLKVLWFYPNSSGTFRKLCDCSCC